MLNKVLVTIVKKLLPRGIIIQHRLTIPLFGSRGIFHPGAGPFFHFLAATSMAHVFSRLDAAIDDEHSWCLLAGSPQKLPTFLSHGCLAATRRGTFGGIAAT